MCAANAFDVVVIGSGFGGAITACRLAESGYKVLILERGRRWIAPKYHEPGSSNATPYPRKPEDPWIWSNTCPERLNGWADFRVYPHMTVVQGAGVGGGSLIYANISAEADPSVFANGWPSGIRYSVIKPYYAAVATMMNVQQIPRNQWNGRTILMEDAANQAGYSQRFQRLELAVRFDPTLNFTPPNYPDPYETKVKLNAEGIEQGYCTHSGECDIGCPVEAKNTLALNYLPRAEKHGALVQPLCLATRIAPAPDGFAVSFDRLQNGRRIPDMVAGRIVIVAAGAMGSTELLLKCRDHYKTLPAISAAIGQRWSSNGDFLTPAFYPNRIISPSKGPTISSAIDFRDRSQKQQSFWIQDGGLPYLLGNYLGSKVDRPFKEARAKAIIALLQKSLLQSMDPFQRVMPWFAQGVDAGNGRLRLRKPWYFFGEPRLHLYWDAKESRPLFDEIAAMHRSLSKKTHGDPLSLWPLDTDLITPHPLGGCIMSDEPKYGVVDHKGEVFGYRNLFVADAAIIPTPLGVNPSRTIGALAERIADIICSEQR
jgi:cholesterol oxidase